jgi:hypothetical protein
MSKSCRLIRSQLEHDLLVCGLMGYDGAPPCPGCAAAGLSEDEAATIARCMRRDRHTDPARLLRALRRSGPQPHNRIAGTPEKQLRRALRARGPRRHLASWVRQIVLTTLQAELPEAVAVLVQQQRGGK